MTAIFNCRILPTGFLAKLVETFFPWFLYFFTRYAYGMWLHVINLLVYIIFLISLTTFVAIYDFKKTDDFQPNTSGNWQTTEQPEQQNYMQVCLYITALNSVHNL